MNYFIDTHVGRYPIEFRVLDYDPAAVEQVDSILIGLHMFRSLTTTWKDELLKRNMLTDGDPAKVNYLFPARSGSELQPGSNAWVLASSHSAQGGLCSPTIRTWSRIIPASGTWCTWKRRA